ncbi:MAG: hypothetical protein AAB487_02050 [Patescibacteria group bacterium]
MLNIPQQYKSLEFVKDIKWSDIFNIWKEGEAQQDSWKKHWEERGFKSWEEWRNAYAEPLDPQNLQWSLYRINDPIIDLPHFYGVPSRGWVDKAYGGKTTMELKDLVALPLISENEKVAFIKKDFPNETMLTGIVYDNRIVLIEGQHRACALASWDKEASLNSKITIALATLDKTEIPILGTGDSKKK